MKSVIFLLSIIILSATWSCGKKKLFGSSDSTRWTDQDVPLNELDTINVNTDSVATSDEMRKLFPASDSLIEGRPVSFYLNRADVSPIAKNFYLLRFIPSEESEGTYYLLDSLLTKNDTTRPFYYFLFVRFFRLGGEWEDNPEILPDIAVHYSMIFPDEFYKKLNMPVYGWTWSHWAHVVSLNKIATDDIKTYIIQTQTKNAKHMTPALRKQIEKFATDVASNG